MKIGDLPKRIKELCLKEHKVGPFNDEPFTDETLLIRGCSWKGSKDGKKFWAEINRGNFIPFYKKYGFGGKIEGFPFEVVMKMCEHQVMQGNKWDVEVFERSASSGKTGGGFTWENTVEGHSFWQDIIHSKKFNMFYDYHKKDDTKNTEPMVPELNIPEGYELDLKESTKEKIVLKQKKVKIKTYEDLLESKINPGGYFIFDGELKHNSSIAHSSAMLHSTEKGALREKASAIISQLMPHYGGAIRYDEWNDKTLIKYVINRFGSSIKIGVTTHNHNILAFRTKELRDEFLENNDKLVKEYLMLN